jgi:tetratricopeptide (TPR) repeat protein
VAARSGLLEELLAVYEEALERGAGPELSLALWRRIAQVRSEKLPDRDAAAAAWEEVARRAPHDLEPLKALAAIWREAATRGAGGRALAPGGVLESAPEPGRRRSRGGPRSREQGRTRALAARCYSGLSSVLRRTARALEELQAILSAGRRHGRWPR